MTKTQDKKDTEPALTKNICGLSLPKSTMIKYINYNNKKIGVIVSQPIQNNSAMISVGFSVCNLKDKFDKETGIKIALKRADRWFHIYHDEKNPFGDLFTNQFYQIMKNDTSKSKTVRESVEFFINRCKTYYKNSSIYTPFGTIEMGIQPKPKKIVAKKKTTKKTANK